MTQYSVTWDAYQQSICTGLVSLQQRGNLVDMTLAADGHHVKVHQLVMSLVSPYIQELIASASCPHPVIFLNKISIQTLNSILQYAYTGEVLVANEKIQEFFNACKELHIRGMENTVNPDESTSVKPTSCVTHREAEDINIVEENEFEENIEEHTIDDDYDVHNDDDDVDMHHSLDDDQRLGVLQIEQNSHHKDASVSAATLQYTVSNMGGVQVVLNRYIYNWRSSRKNGMKMWRCKDFLKKKCRALVRSKDDVVLARAGAHNHPFHDETILKRVHNNNMFSSLREVQQVIDTRESKKSDKAAAIEQVEMLDKDYDIEARDDESLDIGTRQAEKTKNRTVAGSFPITDHNKALQAFLAKRKNSMPYLED